MAKKRKQKSIFKQLLLPIIAIVSALALTLAAVIVVVFRQSYEKEISQENQDKSKLVAGEIAMFMDGAYEVTEELSVNPSILTMDTEVQTPILADCVERNTYLELLYIQGTDGMQTGRSSGELADRSTRWWFIQTMEEQKPFVSKSYYSVNTGMPCASIFFPMYCDDALVGIFAVDLKLDYLQSLIEEFSDMEGGEYSFVIDGEGVVVAHPDSVQIEELYNYKNKTRTVSQKDSDGKPLTDKDGNILTEEKHIDISEGFQKVIEKVMAGKGGSGKIKHNGESYYVSYASIPMKGESDSWSIITMHKEASAMATVNRMILIAILVTLIGVIAAVLVISLLARKLTKPIVSITELIGNASEGDFATKADETANNELGTLSKSFNLMTGKVSGILGRLTTFSGEVVQNSGRLQTIESDVDGISQALREITRGTESQNEFVNQAVEKANELEENFALLREKNARMIEEMQSTITSQESGARSVEGLKQQNEETARRMEESYQKIMTLEEQSQKISGIVSTIEEISSETSLLALNASIEAARAGEAGRGFAVVAESIGKLAQDSSAATGDIEQIILTLCQDIEDTVSNIEAIKQNIDGQTGTVDKVQETFDDFRTMVEQTRQSMDEIEAMVEQMHACDRAMVDAVESIGEVSSHTAQLSEQAADSLEEQLDGIRNVSRSVDDLSQASGEMEQEMTKFKL